MSYSNKSRYSRSPSPLYERDSRSYSRRAPWSRSRSRSASSDVENPGNNLYVTGLSPRVTKRVLEKHFAAEGEVVDVHLVVDPWSRESRGFGFVTMATIDDADRCVKYLDRSVLEGRVITVEKFLCQQARRRRGRTPTPGRYMGLRTVRGQRRTPSYSPRRSPSYSLYSRSRSRSYSSGRSRSRSLSPRDSRRSYSPYYRRRRSYSPHYSWHGYSRSCSPYSRSPVRRRGRSYSREHRYYSPDSRYYSRSRVRRRDRREHGYYSPDSRYYRRYHYRSVSRSPTPHRARSSRRSYSRSLSRSPRRSSRRYSSSVSPSPRRSYRKSYSRSPPS